MVFPTQRAGQLETMNFNADKNITTPPTPMAAVVDVRCYEQVGLS